MSVIAKIFPRRQVASPHATTSVTSGSARQILRKRSRSATVSADRFLTGWVDTRAGLRGFFLLVARFAGLTGRRVATWQLYRYMFGRSTLSDSIFFPFFVQFTLANWYAKMVPGLMVKSEVELALSSPLRV